MQKIMLGLLLLLTLGLGSSLPALAQEDAVDDPTPTRESWITPTPTECIELTPELVFVSQSAPDVETPVSPEPIEPALPPERGVWLSFGEYLFGIIVAMLTAGGFTLAGLVAGLRSKDGKDKLEAIVLSLLPDTLRQSVVSGLRDAGEIIADVKDVFDGKPNTEATPRG